MNMIQDPDAVTIGGRFGWALTKALAKQHPDWQILFVMRDKNKADEASRTGKVDDFFSDKIKSASKPNLMQKIVLPDNVHFHSLAEFQAHFKGNIKQLFIPAVPSSKMRQVLQNLLAAGIPKNAFESCEILAVSKGMETGTLKFPHEIIDAVLSTKSVVALGGNLAFDAAIGDPMLVEFAGYSANTTRCATFFWGTNLIIYETLNRRKLSLAGPMKNIHSLATGMTSEIFGNSSVSSVATMGLSEYERAAFVVQFRPRFHSLARALQKIPFNFRSVPIAGGAMSDYHLFRFTRNFSAGQSFVKEVQEGKNAAQAMAAISQKATIESFTSAAPTRDFLRKLGCFCPVIEITTDILLGRHTPEQGIQKIIAQKNLVPT